MTLAVSGDSITFPDNSVQATAPTGFGFKNRIINGAMVIDQRNAGASVTATSNPYTLDRWRAVISVAAKFTVQQNAAAITPPTGFTNYLGVTSSSAYSSGAAERFVVWQQIEGFNMADLAWGTASAATVTLSFWVRSSLTGTFGGSLSNGSDTRSYPFNYTISLANTWEQKSVTIAGDTSGTWATGNTAGINVNFNVGSGSSYLSTANAWASGSYFAPTGATSVIGTNGATFYITGVQLEKGSTATSFDYRPYGTELGLCQRYYYKVFPAAVNKQLSLTGNASSTTVAYLFTKFPVTMRVAPTALEQVGTANKYAVAVLGTAAITCSGVPTYEVFTTNEIAMFSVNASGLTQNLPYSLRSEATNGALAYLAWSAEL